MAGEPSVTSNRKLTFQSPVKQKSRHLPSMIDVAARGLNMDDVINYDYPNNSEDYIHRIGKILLYFI